MISRLKSIILIVALFLGATPVSAQSISRIAAIVNDDVISVFDLQQRISLSILSSGMQNRPDVRQRLAPQILRGLIDERLKVQEAKSLNYEVDDKLLSEALVDIATRNKIPGQDMVAFLESKGIDGETLKDQVRATIVWQKVLNREVQRTVILSDDAVEEEMAKIEANKGKPERLVSEIFLAVGEKQQEGDVLHSAQRLIQQIKQGANFGSAAQQFSQSASAAVGGDLGWVIQGQLAKELEATLQTLNAGEISDPIRTMAGYHILYLRDKRISGSISANQIKVNIEQVVIGVPPNPNKEILDAKMAVANQVVLSSNNCATFADLGKQVGTEISGNLGTLKLGQLPKAIRDTVSDLPVNRASQPFVTKQGIISLMLCSRKNPKQLSKIARRDKIRKRMETKLIQRVDQRLMRDLRRAAFIDIRI